VFSSSPSRNDVVEVKKGDNKWRERCNPQWRILNTGVMFLSGDKMNVICSVHPPLQPFPLQEAREVHGLVVGGKWSSTQIITNYSVGRKKKERESW